MPQFAGSLFKSAHVAPQAIWPNGQSQTPPMQICPIGHAVPHVPQFAVSK
jgi:hypothetical protein